MKAIILAAGQGTRLKKYTENLPKGMLSFMGKTIIERQLEIYRAQGIDRIAIVRGYAAEKIAYGDVVYYNNTDFANTNMVESLLTAQAEFDDDCIVSYSDILFESGMLREMMQSPADIGVAVDDDWKTYWQARYGRVDFDTESLAIDENNHITELGLENPPMEQISARYIGLLKFSREALAGIRETMRIAYRDYPDRPWQQSGKPVRKAYMTDLLNAMIEAGRPVEAVRFRHGWIEFDTNEDYEKALSWAQNGTLEELIRL
ncbi:MAG: phosphocholine cytidylyltransferase family protein [Lachnospiraceae bacterium]|nr:phosphocholine cytidylyltransferase family protein [Lachnospiraceae bacterium]